MKDSELFLSVVTLGEISKGAAKLRARDEHRAIEIESWLRLVRSLFADRILDVTADVAVTWGQVLALQPSSPSVDGLIAATAISRDLVLVTRDSDFARFPVRTLNPCEYDRSSRRKETDLSSTTALRIFDSGA